MGLSKWMLLGVFALKIIAALALHAIYTYYYPVRTDADVFKYFDDAQALFAVVPENPSHFFQIFFGSNPENLPHLQPYFENTWHWIRPMEMDLPNDNQTIIRINMLMMFLSWGNIFVHHILSAFISLIAFCLLYKVFISYFPQQKIIVCIGIFLIPSSLFWASAMLKECVVMVGLGLFLYGLHRVLQRAHWRSLFTILCGLFILLCIKVYILAALVPASIAFVCCTRFPHIRVWKIYTSTLIVSIILLVANQLLHGLPLFEALANKRAAFITQAIDVKAQSYIAIGNLDNSLRAFLIDTPVALWRAYILPYVWNIRSIMDILPALESCALTVMIVLACVFPSKTSNTQKNLIAFSFTFSFVLLWFVGITTPTIGGIVRYRMPLLPFLATSLALCIDYSKIVQRFKILK
jgi:hypothetical protein